MVTILTERKGIWSPAFTFDSLEAARPCLVNLVMAGLEYRVQEG